MTAALLSTVRRHARTAPRALALADERCALERAELVTRVERESERLRQLGARSLALLAGNGVDWVVAALAALDAGVTLVPLPPFFTLEQQCHVLRSVRPDGLLCDDAGALAALASGTPREAGLGALLLVELPGGQAPPPHTARITFTSGSTGTPKGICLSAKALAVVAHSLAEATGFGPRDRHLCTLPLSVLLEELAGPWRALVSGATCLLPDPQTLGGSGTSASDGARLAGALSDARATGAVLVPAMLEGLVEALEAGTPRPGALRLVGVGGAPVPTGLLRRAARLGLPVREGYGLSEAGSVVALDLGESANPGHVGTPLSHARVELSDDGELLVGGPGLAHGWLDEAGRYRSLPLRDGLYATGDLASRDPDGSLSIRGRRRNVYITSFGRNVSPEWVERQLHAHPDVLQAVVFGEGLASARAVVVPRRRSADLEAVRQTVNATLPDYARLDRLVRARAPFDVANGQWAATGRPRRDAIATAYADELHTPAPSLSLGHRS